MAFDPDVKKRLEQAFAATKRRIVFWEDDAGEFADTIGELELDSADVAVVDKNEFETKRLLLCDEPNTRFLVYRAGGAGDVAYDFLLDVKLAAEPFSCSQAAVWAQDCGLGPAASATVAAHSVFFEAAGRRGALAAYVRDVTWLENQSDEKAFDLALVAVCCDVNPGLRIDVLRGIGRKVVSEYAKDSDALERLIGRCRLDDALWRALKEGFGYATDKPSIEDFCLELMANVCIDVTGEEPTMNGEAVLLVDSLSRDSRDTLTYAGFVKRAKGYVLSKRTLDEVGAEALTRNAYLPDVERVIVSRLLAEAEAGTDVREAVRQVMAQRTGFSSFERMRGAYRAILAACEVLARWRAFDDEWTHVSETREVFDAYAKRWSLIDRWYRIFLGVTGDGVATVRERLAEAVEARYGQYLISLSLRWQECVLNAGKWVPDGIAAQRQFHVLDSGASANQRRTAVVISDALRWECGVELAERLGARYEVQNQAVLSTVPSYTQLGMAALLPNAKLSIDPKTLHAFCNGQDATASANRGKILAAAEPGSVVVRAKDMLASHSLGDASKARLSYVYHNEIDHTGDDINSERKVFEAVDAAFEDIETLVAMLVRDGYSRVYVTADHGFLYQDGDPATFAYAGVDMDLILASDEAKSERRFVAVPYMPHYDDLMEFKAEQLGLEGDYLIGVPKGIRRLRLKGSGARFVHGGLTLQETVIPVIRVERRRGKGGAAQPVGVEALTGGKTIVVGADLSFQLLQCDAVDATHAASHVRVAAYDAEGKAISQVMEFDLISESDDANARRIPVRLTLAAEVPNGAAVTLRVDRRIGESNKYENGVATQTYKVRRNFGMDFF